MYKLIKKYFAVLFIENINKYFIFVMPKSEADLFSALQDKN